MAFNSQGLLIGNLNMSSSLCSKEAFAQRMKNAGCLQFKEKFDNVGWTTVMEFAQCAGLAIDEVSQWEFEGQIGKTFFQIGGNQRIGKRKGNHWA